MTQKNESTQIALIQLSMTNLQKDVTDIKVDMKEIRNSKYITQNDLSLALQEQAKQTDGKVTAEITKVNNQLTTISDKVSTQNKVFGIIGGTALVAIIGALLKLIFKI